MNERAPLPEIVRTPEPGPVLLFAPHPDDDIMGAGGTAALHARQGDPVHVVVAYDGLAGDPDELFDRETYIAARHAESLAGGEVLGLSDYEFWDYPEGHEPHGEELRAAILRTAARVEELRPATVLAPWIGEHHLDHHVLARVVRAALALTGFEGRAWGYEVWTPLVATRVVDVSDVYELKTRAIACHETQLRYRPAGHFMLGLNASRGMYLPEGLYGEGFAPLGPPYAADVALARG